VSSLPDTTSTIRIAIVGAPGTGKSTLAGALVPQIKCLHLDVEFCREAARDYLLRTGETESPLEQLIMMSAGIDREDELEVHDYVVGDSATFLSDVYFSYMRYKAGRLDADPKLDYAQTEIARVSRERLRRFHHIFYVPEQDFGRVKDPTRIYTEDQSVLGRMIRGYMDSNLVNYHVVKAVGVDRRVREVMKVLEARSAFPAQATARPTGRHRRPPVAVSDPAL
jgi:cytidylate kinase